MSDIRETCATPVDDQVILRVRDESDGEIIRFEPPHLAAAMRETVPAVLRSLITEPVVREIARARGRYVDDDPFSPFSDRFVPRATRHRVR